MTTKKMFIDAVSGQPIDGKKLHFGALVPCGPGQGGKNSRRAIALESLEAAEVVNASTKTKTARTRSAFTVSVRLDRQRGIESLLDARRGYCVAQADATVAFRCVNASGLKDQLHTLAQAHGIACVMVNVDADGAEPDTLETVCDTISGQWKVKTAELASTDSGVTIAAEVNAADDSDAVLQVVELLREAVARTAQTWYKWNAEKVTEKAAEMLEKYATGKANCFRPERNTGKRHHTA